MDKRNRFFQALCAAWIGAGSLLAVAAGRAVPLWSGPAEGPAQEAIPFSSPVPPPQETAEGETEAAELEYEPLPSVLNLAFVYPDGTESSDVMDSRIGPIYRELEITDLNWLDEIYNLSGLTPEQMAGRLGIPPEAILGKYDRENENHNLEDPSSWKVGAWKQVNLSVLDGDGRRVSRDSNVKEILSMASVYTYFHDYEAGDLFLDYAKELWERSHSYSISMSDVYYCGGCVEEEGGTAGGEEAADGTSQAETVSGDEAVSSGEVSPASAVSSGEVSSAGTVSSEASSSLSSASSGPGVEMGSAIEESIAQIEESLALGDAATPSDIAASSAAASPSAVLPTDAAPGDTGEFVSCPGHIDLHVTVRIAGTAERNNSLFSLDQRGSAPSENWPGWTEEMRALVAELDSQDWYQQYGLSISDLSLQPPISQEDMDRYLGLLPEDLSAERRELIRFALESVGRVPYYWGGKASSPGYTGNLFGALVEPDPKGRIKKGLDCSGWVSWVYWSVTGERLAAKSTAGLIHCGSPVARSQLKPGDIIIRTGDEAHVIMFLAWEENGRILCIHESSGAANNVTVSSLDANWEHYRKLLE